MKLNLCYHLVRKKKITEQFTALKAVLFLFILFSVQIEGQNTEQKNITFKVANTPLREVFKIIEKQSNYLFFFIDKDIENITTNVDVKNKSVNEALALTLKNTSLTYSIDKNYISISRVKPKKITGLVTDEKSEPIIGASVLLKGSNTGTITNIDGIFSIEAEKDEELTISYIGYKPAVLKVSNANDYTIKLTEDAKTLDEVIVVGYGTQLRSNVSASIGNYKPSEMTSRQSLGVEGLLQGRVPGVVISTSSGIPGSKNRVSIRGAGSLTASNEPLYVIDGVPINSTAGADLGNYGQAMNSLDNLNPDDIESIDVLKDASSAAIYGSRATNGVIIITTKSGTKGKPKVAVNVTSGIQWLPRTDKVTIANSETYLEVMNEAIDNWNIQKGTNEVPRLEHPFPGKEDTNWLSLILRNAQVHNVNLSVSGGNEQSNYYISGNIRHHEGVFKGNAIDKYNFKINQNSFINKRFSTGVNLTLSYSNNNRVPTGYNIGSNLLPRALEQRTWDSPVKPDGTWYRGGVELLNHNPVQILNEEDVYVKNFRTIGSLFGKLNITDYLNYKVTFGGDVGYTEEHVYYTSNHPYGNAVGRLVDERRLLTSYLIENLLTFDKTFNKLYVNAIAGHSFQIDSSSSAGQTGIGFPSRSFDVNSVAAEIQNVSTGLSAYALQSYFTRLQLNYNKRYLISMSIRTDGSSRFAPENRYGYFPSASAGWMISEEDFWPIKRSSAKIRASYGSTGNQTGIETYAYRAIVGGGYNYNNQNGLGISSSGNRNLQWEKADQSDVGIDLSFLNGAITFTADAFIKDTKNLLFSRPTSPTIGFTSYMSNIGSMQNKGMEFTAGYNLNKGSFSYQTNFNISFVKNKLTSLLGDDVIIRPDATHILKVGEEVGSFYMIKQIGIYQSDEEIPAKIYAQGVRAGDVMYEDVNEDGDIDRENDSQIVGSANPKFTAGWNHSFKYKNFDFSFFLNSSYGNKVYQLWTGGYRMGNGTWPMLQSEADKRWTGPGTSNTVPRAIYGVSWNSTKFPTTRFLHDGSYIRLRNATLGYTLPKKLVKKLHIESCRFYVQGDNLFLITKYPLLDPEVSVNLSPANMGYDFLLPSQPVAINLGVNIKL